MTNRIFIDAPSGVIELEGENDFIEAHLKKLLPLIEACGLGRGAPVGDREGGTEGNPDSSADSSAAGPSGEAKRTKRTSRPPKGQSCADRIMVLRDDGFFKEHQTPSQIVEGLAKHGWTHNSNQVSAAAGNMFTRGDIQRTKKAKGFAYFWDRG